jgi:hypothetical protein
MNPLSQPKHTLFLFLALTLTLTSQSLAASLYLRDEAELANFIQTPTETPTEVEPNPDANSPAASPTAEIRMGEIINASTGQSIQVLCTKGTREACEVVSFYLVAGVRAPTPFKVTSLGSINQDAQYRAKRFRFWAANAWLIDDDDALNAFLWFPLPVGPVLTIVDTILFPVRGVAHLAGEKTRANKYKNARKLLYRALTTGASVEVNEKTHARIESLILKTK